MAKSIFSLFHIITTGANERSTHTSTNLKLKAADSQINFPDKSSYFMPCLKLKKEEMCTSPSPHAYLHSIKNVRQNVLYKQPSCQGSNVKQLAKQSPTFKTLLQTVLVEIWIKNFTFSILSSLKLNFYTTVFGTT